MKPSNPPQGMNAPSPPIRAIRVDILNEPPRQYLLESIDQLTGAVGTPIDELSGEFRIRPADQGGFAITYTHPDHDPVRLIVEDGERFTLAEIPLRCSSFPKYPEAPAMDAHETTIALYSHQTGKLTLHTASLASLEIKKSDGSVETTALQEETTIIGKDSHCQVRISDPLVSDFHAGIHRKNDRTYILQDLGSENGVFHNGALVTSAQLASDDVIILGDTDIQFRLKHLEPSATDKEKLFPHSDQYEVFQVPQVLRHEMRNYLQVLEASCDHLAQKSQRIPTEVRKIGEVRERMESLLSMFRTVTAIDPSQAGDIDGEILRILGIHEYQLQKKGIKIVMDLNITQPVHFDRIAMGQVFSNIITNAIQAMNQEGTINVTSSIVGSTAIVRIKDSGPGIQPDILPNLFKPLTTTKKTGSGLGLFISSYILLKHGGRIEAVNLQEGGALFTVSWPGVKG